ncbi:cytochrome P450 72A397-like [Macadamia integrifolia]|uniref:cytochrome P450 72A397-like n=1 Tax=Macadamia integrifolia TaxID=60698 RepID=UPI001C531261|nr:cytochrome P450 72A397-like [Macadamia integrifolia]
MAAAMGEVGSSVVMVTLGSLILWCVWKLLDFFWLQPKKLERLLREQGYDLTPYKFPFGNMFDYAKMQMESESKPIKITHAIAERVAPWNLQIIRTYGKKSAFWIGTCPHVHVMDPGLAYAILNEKSGIIKKPELDPITKMMAYGIFNYEGDKWSLHRRIMNPAFHLEKLKFMSAAINTSTRDMINGLLKEVPSEEYSEVDVWPYMDTLSADFISRTLFGSSYEEGKRIFHIQHEQAELGAVLIRSIYVPGYRYVPTKDNRRMKETNAEVTSLLTKIINGKVKVLKKGESHKDLLSLLLESFYQDQGKITIEDIIGHCKVFYFAGQETVAVLLTWAMVVLSLHPEWQVRAREEVFQVFGNEKPHWDGLNQLKIIPMILFELLRLYPPAPTLFRFTNKDFKHGDTTLPAGVQIVIPTVVYHHSSEFWGKDVDEFKPERFSEGVAKATNNQFLFFPFGGGHRICIGQQFAMVETKLGLATILQRFAFELSPSYTHTPANIVTLRPQQGVHLKLRRL